MVDRRAHVTLREIGEEIVILAARGMFGDDRSVCLVWTPDRLWHFAGGEEPVIGERAYILDLLLDALPEDVIRVEMRYDTEADLVPWRVEYVQEGGYFAGVRGEYLPDLVEDLLPLRLKSG